jgi:hypothetical protein
MINSTLKAKRKLRKCEYIDPALVSICINDDRGQTLDALVNKISVLCSYDPDSLKEYLESVSLFYYDHTIDERGEMIYTTTPWTPNK